MTQESFLALGPNDADAKRLNANVLTGLGERCLTATGSNDHLTVAAELVEPVPKEREGTPLKRAFARVSARHWRTSLF